MAVELNSLSSKQLDVLIQQARSRATLLRKRKPLATVQRKVAALLKAEGYTVEEVFGTGSPAQARPGAATKKAASKSGAGRKLGKVPVKYRNPANKEETWTGRGLKPRWMTAQIAKGKKPEDFLIKG